MINEHDINDWERGEVAPLYAVKNKSYIEFLGVKYWYDHLDGMYSYCVDANNAVVHLSASAMVTPLSKKKDE